jgi:hypothetical protein
MTEDLSKKYAIVTTVSSFYHYYVVPLDQLQELNIGQPVEKQWLEDSVVCEEVEEFSQKHIGEQILESSIIDEDKMLEMFDKNNNYLTDWPKDQKIAYVRRLLKVDRGYSVGL